MKVNDTWPIIYVVHTEKKAYTKEIAYLINIDLNIYIFNMF